jgi:sporulation protein YlmC with PRC-barrel domain
MRALEPAAPSASAQHILLFDDECGVCRHIARWVRKSVHTKAGEVTLIARPIGEDPEAIQLLNPHLDIWQAYATIHLLMPDGTPRPAPPASARGDGAAAPSGPGPDGAGLLGMLRSLKDLERYTVAASDGDLGRVVDFLIDDEHWRVRHLIVETGGFLAGRRVLISPISFREADWSNRCFHVNLTMDQVKNSPSVDTALPVSRQHEWDTYRYYGYAPYWGDFMPWRMGDSALSLGDEGWNPALKSDAPPEPINCDDMHLRSAREVRGYHVDGQGEDVGHVDDFVVDDQSWGVRYLAIATSAWWFGKKVLIAPQWATRIDWAEGKVFVDQSREAIKASPEWDPEAPINREYEVRLFDYYGRPVYGQADAASASPPSR